jgi:DNA uptake protein ComE-like DNA-binding protein
MWGTYVVYYAKRITQVPGRYQEIEINVLFLSKDSYDRLQPKPVRTISALMLAFAIFLTAPSGAPAFAVSKSSAAKMTSGKARPHGLVDINHATIAQLKSLPGVQDALAAKIVKNRPYANKTQLSSKGVISAATYKKIRALVIAKQ